MMPITVGAAVVMLAVVCLSGQSASRGLQITMWVEARRIPDVQTSDMVERSIARLLPEAATLTFVTDGQSVRNTISHRMFGFADGTVRLASPGRPGEYVVNPGDRTYYLSQAQAVPAEQIAEIEILETGRARKLFGYSVREVSVRYRPTAQEWGADVVNWCTDKLMVPREMSRMMDLGQRLTRSRGNSRYDKACPVILASEVRLVVLAGYEIVMTTQSIHVVADVRPDLFNVPAGYRQVPPPK